MKRTVVRLSGMPFDPTYETDDDTIAIGDLVRVPGSNDRRSGSCHAKFRRRLSKQSSSESFNRRTR
jgi:hypothetical protein